jgi:ribosomal protein L11 methyltransferase
MPPPEKLFIYEIEGRVNPPLALTGPDFLGLWREGGYSYLFFSTRKAGEVQTWLATTAEGRYHSETELNFADWEAGQPLKPTRVAGFYLCPIWETPDPTPGDILIRQEAGQAFGSGYHPTTRLCLELLRRVYNTEIPQQVLDFGAGSGILALAAMALGSRRVIAVEYNDLAVRAAQRNLRHNHRQDSVLLIQGDARHFAALPGDLALANIHLDVLLDLLDTPGFLTKKWYIFSGLLGSQVEKFTTRLKTSPLNLVEVMDENLWFALLARHRGDKPLLK